MKDFDKLAKLVERLRAKDGCEWDKAQTLKTIKKDLMSEAREVAAAIDNEDYEGLKEELGDLIWTALLVAQIAKEEKLFDIEDSLKVAAEKLVRRHPHVFGDVKVKNGAEALASFREAKRIEKEAKPEKTYKIPLREFVATVYVVKDDKVLLIHHKKLKMWIPVGGHINENELPCEAAKREVFEETGLKVRLIGSEQEKTGRVRVLIHPFTIQLEDIKHNHQHIDLIYYAEVTGGKEKINKDETFGMKWFSEKDLNKSDGLGALVKEQAVAAIKYFKSKKIARLRIKNNENQNKEKIKN